jgi:hypothetical protein
VEDLRVPRAAGRLNDGPGVWFFAYEARCPSAQLGVEIDAPSTNTLPLSSTETVKTLCVAPALAAFGGPSGCPAGRRASPSR